MKMDVPNTGSLASFEGLIPCILWGRTALAAAEYPTGTELTLTGRLQSRTYLKNLGETSETRTAYEFSVSACERVPEFAIF